jgi:hypothetical protein
MPKKKRIGFQPEDDETPPLDVGIIQDDNDPVIKATGNVEINIHIYLNGES